MDVLWKNLVYSLRMLLKRPSLTAVAIIAIALGIGANTAIFFRREHRPAATASLRTSRTTRDDRDRATQPGARRPRQFLHS